MEDNIYVTFSCLQSMDGLIILQNITMQDISKANLKKGLLEMLELVSKHNITKKSKIIIH
jgi:IMP cyclohydrolase